MIDINTCCYEEIVQILELYPTNIKEFLGTRTDPLPSEIIREYFDVIPTNYFRSLTIDKIKSCKLKEDQLKILNSNGVIIKEKNDFEMNKITNYKNTCNTKIIDPNTRDLEEIKQIFTQNITYINDFLDKRTVLLPSKIIKEYFDNIPIDYFKSLSVDKIKSCNLEDNQVELLYIEDIVNEKFLIENKYLKIVEKYSAPDIVEKCIYEKNYNDKMIDSMFESDMPQLDHLEYSRKIFNDSNLSLEEARSRNCNDYMKKIDGIWY